MPQAMPKGLGPNAQGPRKSPDERARELIGQAIRVRREKARMSQQEAAEAIGVSRNTLARWEQGEGSLWTGGDAGCVDHLVMVKLKQVYDCRICELLPKNHYPSAPVDPALRREFFWRRNAQIQGVEDEEGYVEMMRERHATRAGAQLKAAQTREPAR